MIKSINLTIKISKNNCDLMIKPERRVLSRIVWYFSNILFNSSLDANWVENLKLLYMK